MPGEGSGKSAILESDWIHISATELPNGETLGNDSACLGLHFLINKMGIVTLSSGVDVT